VWTIKRGKHEVRRGGNFRDFTLNGHWWLPSDPNGAAYGTLSYSVDRIKLRLDRAFTPKLDTAYGVGSVKIPVILGRANDSSSITVLRAFYWGSNRNEIDLLANEIVVGAHLDSARAVVREAVVGFTNLEEWTAYQLVQQSAGDGDATVRFFVTKDLKPNLQVLGLPSLKRLSLSTDLQVSHDLVETKLTNQSRFTLEFSHPATLQTVTDSVRSLGNLLALLMDEPAQPTTIRLMMQFQPTGPDIFANYAIPPRATLPKKKPEFEMLLPFNDLHQTNTAETLFNNWFQKEQVLRPVYDLLLSTIYSPGQYVQSTFLSLAQALESFHRKVYQGKYISQEGYPSIRKNLIDAIPTSIDEKLSAKLTTMLQYGNELSLKSRLEYLFEGIRSDHLDNLSGTDDSRRFIRTLVDIRNYLTHYEGKKPSILESTVERLVTLSGQRHLPNLQRC
jgi:ApeA N-terminal domain 1